MPRKLHIAHSKCPYHVTARSHDGTWFQIPISIVWEVMTDYLYFIQRAYEVRVHSFVLMNNHFHLLVSTPEANLSAAMNYFMRETSKEINRISGKKNQVYGGRYYRSIISNNLHFQHVYKYIYRNPVSANLTQDCESYRYSTLHGLLGKSPLHIPLEEDTLLFENDNPRRTLIWLNTPPNSQNYEILRKALKRRILKFPRNRWRDRQHTLEMHAF
jgi:REP element-mobilizing transposase RayT